MADTTPNRILEVRLMLSEVRSTLHRAYSRIENEDTSIRLRSLLLEVEATRLITLQMDPRRLDRISIRRLEELRFSLERLIQNLRSTEFASAEIVLRRPGRTLGGIFDDATDRREKITVIEGLERANVLVHLSLDIRSTDGGAHEVRRLKTLLPSQKLAPVTFDIKHGKLVLSHVHSETAPIDQSNVVAARDQLLASGDRLLAELKTSNCDKRLIESFELVHSELKEGGNIIALGLSNLACDMMCSAFSQELPDAVNSLLRSQARGIDLYASQFPEWNRFLENAATAQLAADDVQLLNSATKSVVATLESKPEVVDPEVPKTIARLNELLVKPNLSAKRAAFALLRSLENLVIKVFGYGSDFIDQTAKKTVDKLSTTASTVLVIALLSLALSTATSVAPVASKLNEMSWMKDAAEIVQHQLKQMQRH